MRDLKEVWWRPHSSSATFFLLMNTVVEMLHFSQQHSSVYLLQNYLEAVGAGSNLASLVSQFYLLPWWASREELFFKFFL